MRHTFSSITEKCHILVIHTIPHGATLPRSVSRERNWGEGGRVREINGKKNPPTLECVLPSFQPSHSPGRSLGSPRGSAGSRCELRALPFTPASSRRGLTGVNVTEGRNERVRSRAVHSPEGRRRRERERESKGRRTRAHVVPRGSSTSRIVPRRDYFIARRIR